MKLYKYLSIIMGAILLCSLPICRSYAQPVADDPALVWKGSVTPLGDNRYELELKASVPMGWHIYDIKRYENGPLSTTVTITGAAEVLGDPYMKSTVDEKFDEAFNQQIGTCHGDVAIALKLHTKEASEQKVKVLIEWQACRDGACSAPDEAELTITLPAAEGAPSGIETTAEADDQQSPSRSLWSTILEAIIWGFVALLTPCVFPMVPMTVSFFLKKSGNKARGRFMAMMYGLSIVALYTLPIAILILVTYFAGGDSGIVFIFNWLATHWIPNILFFIIFMLFAASFFGAFEIVMPTSLVNKADAKSDKGGLLGVFFMALTLVLVSFSCTGPIVGTILIKSTQGEIWEPISTMVVFSSAFALPFTIFAFVPSLLKNLPKSGGWLGSVKVVLGFIEVALGLKFLSVADQIYGWGLLDREVYLAIWIVVFSLLGLYLLGKIRFESDSPAGPLSVTRLFLAIAVFSFVVYMVPGMWGAPLKALSGYLPPIESQDFVMGRGVAENIAPAETAALESGTMDYDQALKLSAESGKPVFLDFTGKACVNCREMEVKVLSNPRVKEILAEKYIVLELYGDTRNALPQDKWVTTAGGTLLKTDGKVNSHLLLEKYGVNAMPYYIIMDSTGKALVPPRGYNLNVEDFIDFLNQI